LVYCKPILPNDNRRGIHNVGNEVKTSHVGSHLHFLQDTLRDKTTTTGIERKVEGLNSMSDLTSYAFVKLTQKRLLDDSHQSNTEAFGAVANSDRSRLHGLNPSSIWA